MKGPSVEDGEAPRCWSRYADVPVTARKHLLAELRGVVVKPRSAVQYERQHRTVTLLPPGHACCGERLPLHVSLPPSWSRDRGRRPEHLSARVGRVPTATLDAATAEGCLPGFRPGSTVLQRDAETPSARARNCQSAFLRVCVVAVVEAVRSLPQVEPVTSDMRNAAGRCRGHGGRPRVAQPA